ncbi:MAG: folate-binding protein YgfZ [Phycisphaerales bacterium]|nr:folate-binding protein YgfZ [Phycisphaerales bacterium]MCB9864175.1 folate-binding protein YgfZ [Phycisphaerales bacterium]
MIDDALRAEYSAAVSTGGVFHRDDRGLIEVSGADRADWLHNLVTNVVKTLTPGEGNYAFCINVKGRVVFDLNILVRQDSIWLDIDRRWIDTAMKWLDRYVITEDVVLKDRSGGQDRIAVIGPAAARVCEDLRFGNLIPKAWLQQESRDLGGAHVTMFRHDFTGLIGAEFVVVGDERREAMGQIESAATAAGAAMIGSRIVEILRIEAGIPASVSDIDEDVIPPETGQIERGISYQKGCYLGQEVLERMRSRGGLARKLVGIRLDGASLPQKNAPIFAGEAEVGRVTSAAYSLALDSAMALGYVRSAQASPGGDVIVRDGAADIPGAIVGLPIGR